MEKFEKIKKFIEEIEPDVKKFYEKEFDLTGGRVTVGMQKLKLLAHDLRGDILKIRNENKRIKAEKKKWK